MSWIAVGVGVVGGVASYASSKQQSKAQRNMGQETGSIPFSEQRKQAQKYSFDQLRMMPFFGSTVRDEYGKQATEQRAQQTQGADDMMRQLPAWASKERQLTSAQRAGDMRDFAKMTAGSPAMQSMQQLGADAGTASPLLALLNGDASGLLGGRSQIAGELEKQALGDLRLGRGLSVQEQRDAEQSARGAWASRGLAYSNGAVGAEILGRDSYGRQRESDRRNFAGGVQGILQSEDEAFRRYGQGVEELNQRGLGIRSQVAGAAAAPLLNAFSQRATNPYQSLLGAYGTAMPIAQTANILSQTPSVFQGAQALTPLYNYQADVANTNLNQSASNAASRANLYGQIGGAALTASGKFGESYLKNRATKPTAVV